MQKCPVCRRVLSVDTYIWMNIKKQSYTSIDLI